MAWRDVVGAIAMAAILVGVVGKVYSNAEWSWMVTIAGGLVMFLIRLNERMTAGKDVEVAEQRRIGMQMFSMVMVSVSAYLMYAMKGYWLLPLVVGAVLELYCAFRRK